MPTTITRYVDTTSTNGGNGTTTSITGANRAYRGLYYALATESVNYPNLVTSDVILQFICSGTNDLVDVASSVWNVPAITTDGTRYLHVVAASSSRATSQWRDTYTITHQNNTGLVIAIDNIKVSKWEGVQIENRSTNGVWSVIGTTTPSNDIILTIDGCYLRSINGTGANGTAISLAGGSVRKALRVVNSIIHGKMQCMNNPFAQPGSATSYAYNNTCYDVLDGIHFFEPSEGVTISIKNNIVTGSSGYTQYELSNFNGATFITANNISSDATSPQTGLRNVNSQIAFENPLYGNFKLVNGSTLIDAGANLSADSIYAFSNDINNTTRPVGSAWDIGAYEFVPAIIRGGNAAVFSRGIGSPVIFGGFVGFVGSPVLFTNILPTSTATGLVTNGLILHYDFENVSSYPGSGTTITDLSGLGNTGTLVNSPTYTGTSPKNVSFDGVTKYINVTETSGMTPQTLTIDIVFKINSNTNTPIGGATGNYQNIIFRQNNRTSNYEGYNLQFDEAEQRLIVITTDESVPNVLYARTPQDSIVVGTIYHCALVFINDSVTIYLNGNLAGYGLKSPTLYYRNDHTIKIGRAVPTGTTYDEPMNGNVYSVRMYNRNLSATEVLQNYETFRSTYGI